MPEITLPRVLELIGPAFTIAMLGAIESLLSAVVADGMAGTRHDSNQELIGQGIANLAVPLFGGFAATGAIARTATNVRNGGTGPLAGLFHVLTLVLVLLFLAPLAEYVPLAALAAVLFVVAWNMSEVRHFAGMVRRAPRADVAVLLITFLLTVFVDLVLAVNVGVILAMFQFLRRMSTAVEVPPLDGAELDAALERRQWQALPPGVMVYSIDGPFFFGAVDTFERSLAQTHTDPEAADPAAAARAVHRHHRHPEPRGGAARPQAPRRRRDPVRRQSAREGEARQGRPARHRRAGRLPRRSPCRAHPGRMGRDACRPARPHRNRGLPMKALVCHTLTGIEGLKLEQDWPEPALARGIGADRRQGHGAEFSRRADAARAVPGAAAVAVHPGSRAGGGDRRGGRGRDASQGGRSRRCVLGWRRRRGTRRGPAGTADPDAVARSTFEQASGICLTYFTSYHALKQRAQLAAGETMLVLGAASGVGTTAIELAKQMGAQVIAAASTDAKLEVARGIGADHLINYSTQDLRERIKEITGGKGVDVVYDAVGGPYAEPAVRSLAWKGRYLVVGFAAGDIPKIPMNLLLLKGAALVGVFFGSFAQREPQVQLQNVRELWQLFEAGKLQARRGRGPSPGRLCAGVRVAGAAAGGGQGRAAGLGTRGSAVTSRPDPTDPSSGCADLLQLGMHLEPALFDVAKLRDDVGAASAGRLDFG